MRVGIDIDGVTLDLHSAFRERYRVWFDAPIAQFEHWDDLVDLTHFANYREVWGWCERAGVFHGLPWVPGAPAAIDHLLDVGHSVAFLSSRAGEAAEAAVTWHFGSPWTDRSQIVTDLGNSKHTVPCSVYIDDSPLVIERLLEEGKKVIKFNRPWNREAECPASADTWDDVLTWLEVLE